MTICEKAFLPALAAFTAGLLLAGCAVSPRFATKSTPSSSQGTSSAEGAKSDAGKTSRNPTGKVLLTLEGVASYYADAYNGKKTSNGETYDMNDLTAAHRTFPYGTKVRVTNLENNKSVIVRINDRGPFKEERIIDVSLAAARELDLIKAGTAKVKLEVIEWGDGL